MAKRMTATEKWDKEWFQDLTPKQKCIWDYLTHRCDNAGIWDINFSQMTFSIDKSGEKITEKDLEIFADRLVKFSEDKIFIPSFISFQYGTLTQSCKPHIPVLAKLKKYDLLKLLEFKGYKYPTQGVKDKEKEEEKEKKGVQGGVFVTTISGQRYELSATETMKELNETRFNLALMNSLRGMDHNAIIESFNHEFPIYDFDDINHLFNKFILYGKNYKAVKKDIRPLVGPDGQYVKVV